MDTAALAASFPFTSPDLPRDPAAPDALPGVLYGVNTAGPGLVAWDRWAADNHNSVTLAASGAGKSYLAKLEILRSPVRGHRVLGDRPRGRVRPARRRGRRRVHPPGRAGRAPEPVRPARRRAGQAGHPHPPRPVPPHRHRGAVRRRAVPGRAGGAGQGDHDRLPAGRDHRPTRGPGRGPPRCCPPSRPRCAPRRRRPRPRWPTGSSRSPRAATPACSPPRPPPAPRGTWSSSASATSPTSCARPRPCSPWTPPGGRSPTPPGAGGG